MRYRLTDFDSIVESGRRTRAYVEEQTGKLDPASALATDFQRAEQALEIFKSGDLPEGADADEVIQGLATVASLNRIVQRARDTPFEDKLRPRLSDLRKGVPGQLGAGPQSSARDRVLEMLCAHVATLFAEDTDFQEPDVTCKFQGSRWGIACKALYGNESTASGRLRKGAKQIRRARVDFGVVVLQLTNVFPHDQMYQRNPDTGDVTSLSDDSALGALMMSKLVQISGAVGDAFMESSRQAPIDLPAKVRGVLHVAHTLAYHKGRRAIMGCCHFGKWQRVQLPAEIRFVEEFNRYWQNF